MLIMLNSICEMWEEIHKILEEKDQLERIEGVTKKDLDLMVQFLDPFQNTSPEIEGDNYPTLHLPVLWKINLKKLLEVYAHDSRIIRALKAEAKEYFSKCPKFHILYFVTVFLHPKLKHMKMLSEEEKTKTMEYVAARVKNSQEREMVEDDEVEPKKRRMNTVSDFFEPSNLGELENYKAVGDDESFVLLPW